MNIEYKNIKELPNDQLYQLFRSAKWADGQEDEFKLTHFNCPFVNSTIVISAWDKEKLVGCVRVISDKITRSVIEDLVVLPEYQKKRIGSTLLKKCIELYPKSEWLVPTNKENVEFYKKQGFKNSKGIFMSIDSKWFDSLPNNVVEK